MSRRSSGLRISSAVRCRNGSRSAVRVFLAAVSPAAISSPAPKIVPPEVLQLRFDRQIALIPHKSQERTRRTRWASYAAVAWCVVFGGHHLYWALGDTAGFAEFNMPPNKILALTRDPHYIGITRGAAIISLVAAIAALAGEMVKAGKQITLWENGRKMTSGSEDALPLRVHAGEAGAMKKGY